MANSLVKFPSIINAPLGEVVSQKIGKLKSTIVDKVETMEIPIAHMIPEGLSNLLLPIGVFTYLLVIEWRIALASLITLPISMIVMKIMLSDYNVKYKEYMRSSNHVNDVIVEYSEGIKVIKTVSYTHLTLPTKA